MLTAVLVLFVLFLFNGVFAMSELAVMTSRRSRLHAAAARGNAGAAAALRLAQQPTRFLSTVQVGITLIGILSGAFAERAISASLQQTLAEVPALAPYSGTIALVLVVLGVTYFSLVLGELVPKRLALAFPETISSLIARPLDVLSRVAALPVRLLTFSTDSVLWALRVSPPADDDVSQEDVQALVARAASTGVFTPQEHALFRRTMHAADLTVRDLMVPRTDIVTLDADMTLDHVRLVVGTNPHSHFPVCRGGLDNLVGVVHIKDMISHGLLVGQDVRVADIAHQPYYVPETTPALRLLDTFRGSPVHVAFVVDEYGSILGFLTINDLAAALLGDIQRRGDEPPPGATRRDDGSWLLDGRLPLREAVGVLTLGEEALDDYPDVATIAGAVLALLGHIPRQGEHASWRGWRLEVVDMDGTRIDQLLAARLPGVDARESVRT
jgi:putative hemolysin